MGIPPAVSLSTVQVSLLKKGETLTITTARHWIRPPAVAKTSSSVPVHNVLARIWAKLAGKMAQAGSAHFKLTLHCTDTVDYKSRCLTVLPSDGGWVHSDSTAAGVAEAIQRRTYAVLTGVPVPSLEIRKSQERHSCALLSFGLKGKFCQK